MLALWLAMVAFGLIQVAQSEMWTELEWAQAEAQGGCARIHLGGGRASGEAQSTDGELDGGQGMGRSSGCKTIAGKESGGRLVQRNVIALQPMEQLCFAQATDGNGSDDSGTIRVDGPSLPGKQPTRISKGLELERVARGVEQEHGRLFADFADEADVGLDDEADAGGL